MAESPNKLPNAAFGIERDKTALHRSEMSRPVRRAIEDGLITVNRSVFDYGCGYGDDVRFLRTLGYQATGWDPANVANVAKQAADTVNLGYVLNVIEDPKERAGTLLDAWQHSQEVLIVSARLVTESGNLDGFSHSDGVVTSRRTFQKFFRQDELRSFIHTVLGEPPVAAAPGVFYVFKNAGSRESFLSAKFRTTRIVRPALYKSLYADHKETLELLAEFVRARGRLPTAKDTFDLGEICRRFGSVPKAFATLRKVYGKDYWSAVAEYARQDLLVYLALGKFEARVKFGALNPDLQEDIRAHFGTFKRACECGDELLFSTGRGEVLKGVMEASAIGKITAGGMYVHRNVLSRIAPLLRVYEGCGRVLVGSIETCNLIKLHRSHFGISYLSYPTFETEGHPALAGSVHVDLRTREIRARDYSDSDNPPILHRKELFVAHDHPLHGQFQALTTAEESAGLFLDTTRIGNRSGWNEVLIEKGCYLEGHELRIDSAQYKPNASSAIPKS